jgi:hypothetical protein
MVFYYANTGHKIGLDRLRRGAALVKKLEENGVEARLLVNDFRAGLAAKELGAKEYVTIETVQDIDAIAEAGNSIIIDSSEDDHGRLVKYCADFKNVWRFEHSPEDQSVHGETLIRVACQDEECISAVIVDEMYIPQGNKEERVLFFLDDADYDKTILSNEDFFKAFEMELLLGNYFFVKYEDDLAKLFSTLHEPEEYFDLIQNSQTIVTASSQTALEAKACGAKVIYIDLKKDALYPTEVLRSYGISIVDGFDVEEVKRTIQGKSEVLEKPIKTFDVNKIKNLL